MAITKIADVVVPEVFTPYVMQQAIKTNNLINSGGVVIDGFLSAFAAQGGNTINVPSWEAIDASTGTFEAQTDDDTDIAGLNNVDSGTEVAAKLSDVKTWGAANLASALAGSNPLTQVASKVAQAVNTNRQYKIVSMLKGFFASGGALASSHLNDQSGVAFSADLLIDTLAPWGDQANEQVVLVVHSAIYRSMQKENLITFRPLSDQSIMFPVYMGQYLIVVDDTVPVATSVYTSYMLKPGAIKLGLGNGETVLWSEPLQGNGAGVEYMIQRDVFVPHMTGMAYVGAATGAGPSAATLATAASWAKVYTDKQIPVAALNSLVGA